MSVPPSSPSPPDPRAHRQEPRARAWQALGLNALPGLLAGAHLANLLFFLNPDLPFELAPLLKVILLYGLLCGALSTLLLTPFTRMRLARAKRLLPWTITAVLATIATLDWVYASRYSFYLPPGINLRMIKAAIWLTLTSLVCFYTALLHTLHRRVYGARSRWGFLILALASIYVMAERREAFKPHLQPAPRPSAVEQAQRPTLIVVGLDGASLDAVLPLARQGRLPFFARLLEEGVFARPRSLAPVQREALWTTLATGRLPYKHGIVSERVFPAELVAEGAQIKLLPTRLGALVWWAVHPPLRVDARARRMLPLWEVLERLEFDSGMIAWPVSDPVSTRGSFAFSERYFSGDFREPTALPRGLAERGALFRVDPQEIDAKLLEQLGDRVPFSFLQALAADLWRQSLALFLLDQLPETKALFLVLPGLAEVSARNFGGFAAVQFSGVQRPPFLESAQLITAYYRQLDQFLASLWERQRGPRILAVVSAYGFEAPESWHKLVAQLTGRSRRGRWQRAPDGLLMLAGEGLRAGQFLETVELVDVMPTLLYALGFPIARDLDGRILTGAFSSAFLARHPLTVVPSYETLVSRELLLPFPFIVH